MNDSRGGGDGGRRSKGRCVHAYLTSEFISERMGEERAPGIIHLSIILLMYIPFTSVTARPFRLPSSSFRSAILPPPLCICACSDGTLSNWMLYVRRIEWLIKQDYHWYWAETGEGKEYELRNLKVLLMYNNEVWASAIAQCIMQTQVSENTDELRKLET